LSRFDYDARQQLKKNATDVGISEEAFIRVVRTAYRWSSYDINTKTFYAYLEKQDNTWMKYPIPTEDLERIAFMSGFYGRIPLE
jgi:hypothetical protein